MGIAKGRILPRFHHKTFARWFRERPAKPAQPRRTAMFFTCFVNYNEPQVGRDAVAVLEHNGCSVECPPQVCCGMPYLDAGDIAGATANARRNLDVLAPLVAAGADAVVPQPTCSYVIKKEYPLRVSGRPPSRGGPGHGLPGQGPGPHRVPRPLPSARAEHGLQDPRRAAAHPGHEDLAGRALHGDGRHLGDEKGVLPAEPHLARKVAQEMEASKPDTYMTDCSLAALQVQEIRGQKPAHPASLLREAYGLRAEH